MRVFVVMFILRLSAKLTGKRLLLAASFFRYNSVIIVKFLVLLPQSIEVCRFFEIWVNFIHSSKVKKII